MYFVSQRPVLQVFCGPCIRSDHGYSKLGTLERMTFDNSHFTVKYHLVFTFEVALRACETTGLVKKYPAIPGIL